MAIPSPDAPGFALKYLIAKGDGRETDCWDSTLEEEATRFAAGAGASADQEWAALVADYRAKRARWTELLDVESEKEEEFNDEIARLSPEPQQPATGLPRDISGMTITEIRETANTRADKQAWAEYERDHAAWIAEREALRERMLGEAERAEEAAREESGAAFDLLAASSIPSLVHLAEKIEIIMAEYEGSEIAMDLIGHVLTDVRTLGGLN